MFRYKNIDLEKEGYTAFDSIEALLAEVDVVDIVTPTMVHHQMAIQCLNAGKHVFIEKPITQTWEVRI